MITKSPVLQVQSNLVLQRVEIKVIFSLEISLFLSILLMLF